MWPFKTQSTLSLEDEEWQIQTWRWLLDVLGGREDLKRQLFVQPTPEFFPPTESTGHDRALHVFQTVRNLMGMEQWQCQVAAQPEAPDPRVSETAFLQWENARNQPGGTFGIEGDEVLITYDPKLIDDPVALVATFAHELSHYLLASKSEPPGGWDNHEFCTDLCVVYTGFGLFGAATAFRYYSGTQGWGYQRSGYLTQAEWTFALAVFFALRGQYVEDARPWLPSHLMNSLRRSAKYLSSRPQVLEAIGV